VGDVEKPKLVFFFDEAHLLFNDAPTALLEKIEQVVRLIRSKAWAFTLSPRTRWTFPKPYSDSWETACSTPARLHAARSESGQDGGGRHAPQSGLQHGRGDHGTGVGEALISFLDEKGRPAPVERSFVIAPCSRLGVLNDAERSAAIKSSTIYGHYEKTLDRESAYEKLRASVQGAPTSAQPTPPAGAPEASAQTGGGLLGGGLNDMLFGRTGPRGGKTDGLVQTAAKSVARTIGSSVGREIIRGVLGSLLGGKRGR